MDKDKLNSLCRNGDMDLAVFLSMWVDMLSGPDAVLVFMVDRNFCMHSWEQVIEESEGADIDGVPGLKPSFGCRKEQKYSFNMLALEGVVVDETARAIMQDTWYARW